MRIISTYIGNTKKSEALEDDDLRFLTLQLHDAIYRLRFYSNALTHILSLSNSHNNVASIQKNRGDKSHCVIVALGYNYTVRFIAPILLY